MGIVLNWIVQGVVVAAAAGIGLWLLPAGRARARVHVWWTVIATVIALPLVTWWAGTTPVGPSIAAGVIEPLVVVPHVVWNATSLAAGVWVLWFCLQSLRLCLDLRALARVRRGCVAVGTSVETRLRPSTRARLAKSSARLMVSGDVRAAAVLGCGPPIIAVQPALARSAHRYRAGSGAGSRVGTRGTRGCPRHVGSAHRARAGGLAPCRVVRDGPPAHGARDGVRRSGRRCHRIGQGVCGVPDTRRYPGPDLERIPFGRSDASVPRTDTPRHAAASSTADKGIRFLLDDDAGRARGGCGVRHRSGEPRRRPVDRAALDRHAGAGRARHARRPARLDDAAFASAPAGRSAGAGTRLAPGSRSGCGRTRNASGGATPMRRLHPRPAAPPMAARRSRFPLPR